MADTNTETTTPQESEAPAQETPQEAQNAPSEAPAEAPKDENPWGADFDAERAWKLVQNLRAELKEVKAERREAPKEDAPKEEAPKDGDKLAAAEKRAQDAERALWRERIFREHPELEAVAQFLTADTEDGMKEQAEALAQLTTGNEPPADDPVSTKPTPNLTPGHGVPNDAEPFDAKAIAKRIR